ncbi:putative motility protein [Pseudomonas sp. CAU 1711]|uniref:putative motility protein n=1 Tax=Pseudomonas sp. CAU 1711 TaxID=3140356 RepID=UPI003260E8B2
MELNTRQIATQAAAQASALASLQLLRKTLELQAAGAGNALPAPAPVSTPSNPPSLGNRIDVMA